MPVGVHGLHPALHVGGTLAGRWTCWRSTGAHNYGYVFYFYCLLTNCAQTDEVDATIMSSTIGDAEAENVAHVVLHCLVHAAKICDLFWLGFA